MNRKTSERKLDPHNLPKKLEYCRRGLERDPHLTANNRELILAFDQHNEINQCSIPYRTKCVDSIRHYGEFCKKDFEQMSREDCQAAWAGVLRDERWSPEWKYNLGKTVKTFWKFLKKTDDFPPEIKFLRPKKDKPEPINAALCITPSEIKRMADSAENGRDRCFFKVAWESGARIGELLTLRLRDIEHLDGCAFLNITETKTRYHGGKRKVLIFMFYPELLNWLNEHPRKNDPAAPLFPNMLNGHQGDVWIYRAAMKQYHKAYRRAGIQGKPRHIHWLRHSSISYFYQTGDFTPAELSLKYWGIPASTQLNRYAHLDAYKTAGRITGNGKEKQEAPKPITCVSCKTLNDGLSNFCSNPKCGKPLNKTQIAMAYLLTEVMRNADANPEAKSKLDDFIQSVAPSSQGHLAALKAA